VLHAAKDSLLAELLSRWRVNAKLEETPFERTSRLSWSFGSSDDGGGVGVDATPLARTGKPFVSVNARFLVGMGPLWSDRGRLRESVSSMIAQDEQTVYVK
jgi:hypothetical protein